MTPYPPLELPWYKSKVIVGALISILAKLLVITGLVGDFTDADTAQVTDLVLIMFGALGDLIAIGARVRQKYAPPIVSGSGGKGGGGAIRAFSLTFVCLLVIPLAGCASSLNQVPTSPAAVADQIKVDEQAALTLTLAYTGAAKAAALAIETGLVSDPIAIARIGELDDRAYVAVKAAESAYRAGNADSYAEALQEASSAVSNLLASVKGNAS